MSRRAREIASRTRATPYTRRTGLQPSHLGDVSLDDVPTWGRNADARWALDSCDGFASERGRVYLNESRRTAVARQSREARFTLTVRAAMCYGAALLPGQTHGGQYATTRFARAHLACWLHVRPSAHQDERPTGDVSRARRGRRVGGRDNALPGYPDRSEHSLRARLRRSRRLARRHAPQGTEHRGTVVLG